MSPGKIDIPLLITDLLLIIFSASVSRYLFNDMDIIHHWPSWQLQALYAITMFIVPWYMGYQYGIISGYYKQAITIILLPILVLTILAMDIYMFRILLSVMGAMDKDKASFITGIVSIFIMIIGPVMGIAGYSESKKVLNENDASKGASSYTSWRDDLLMISSIKDLPVAALCIVIMMSVALMTWLGSYVVVKDHFILVLLVFIGSVVVACGIFLYFNWLRFRLRKTTFFNPVINLCAKFIPLIIVALLAVWVGIELSFIRDDLGQSGKISAITLLWILLVTGILPYRVIMLFNPPFKWINFFTGLIALTYFIIKMIQLYTKL